MTHSKREVPQKRAITLGNFDGCHVGHQALIRSTVALAAVHHLQPTVVTFSPRPDVFFGKTPTDARWLFSTGQKAQALLELGIAEQLVITFNDKVAAWSAEEFFREHLMGELNAGAIVVGDNFAFGRGRSGTVETLKRLCLAEKLPLSVISPTTCSDHRPISSSRIREMIVQGNVSAAASALGRPYLIAGQIEKGDQLGRTLGFPTANLSTPNQLIPAHGVYAGFVWTAPAADLTSQAPVFPDLATLSPAAINIGVRPTINDKQDLRIEAHIMTRDGSPSVIPLDSLYGRQAGFYFSHFIRTDRKFADVSELTAAIADDTKKARDLLASVR